MNLVNGRRHQGEEGEAPVLDGGGEPVRDADAVLRDGKRHRGPQHGGEGAGILWWIWWFCVSFVLVLWWLLFGG